MDAVDVIRTKRDGHRLTDAQIEWFIEAYTDGRVADDRKYQPALARRRDRALERPVRAAEPAPDQHANLR